LILLLDGLILLQVLNMNKFFLIDKDLWLSSFDVIRILKKKLNIKRIGHSWTLDPLATGGLLIAVW
jgi:tRNA pseudouridine55 synthase